MVYKPILRSHIRLLLIVKDFAIMRVCGNCSNKEYKTQRSVSLRAQSRTLGKSGLPSGGGESKPPFEDAVADS